jgi:hypothetical protein
MGASPPLWWIISVVINIYATNNMKKIKKFNSAPHPEKNRAEPGSS